MSQKAKIRLCFFVVVSLSITLIISLVIGICFFTSLRKKDSVDAAVNRYRLSIGLVDTGKSTSNVYRANIVRNGVMCTNFSQISEKCGYTMMVNGDEIRFYLNNDDDDMLVLEIGKDVAYVNSNPVHLAVSVYKVGDNVYLPIDFINTYFSGISVVVDDENAKILIEYIEPTKCALRLKSPQGSAELDSDLFPD